MTGPNFIPDADIIAIPDGHLTREQFDALGLNLAGLRGLWELLARGCEEMRNLAQVEGREPEAATG